MEPAFASNVDGDALRQWRRQATDIVLAVSVILHLPVIALFLVKYLPRLPTPLSAMILASYLVTVFAAVFRSIDHRVRVWSALGAIYIVSWVGIFAFPQGPYVRLLPVIAPIFAIGVLGIRSARIATAISSIILLSTPLLHSLPDLVHVFGIHITGISIPAWLDWVQSTALMSEMVIMMVLLERSYDFLLRALTDKNRAIEEQRIAKLKLKEEMSERLRLEQEVARVSDDERRQLGNEIHDGVCQQLTGALLRCQALELRLEQGVALSGEDLDAVSSLLSESINEAHAVAQGLWPLEPKPEALVSALRNLVKRSRKLSGAQCKFLTEGDVRVYDPATAQHLYRIAQEALSNAVRHAHPKRIEVELNGFDDEVILRVQDDGVGIRSGNHSKGMGLRTMASRAQILGSDLNISALPEGGTRVLCRTPRAESIKRMENLEETIGEATT